MKVIGFERGYVGLLSNEFRFLDARGVGGIMHLGGTFLKTSRAEEMKTKEGVFKATEVLKENGVDGLIVIGGDGSFRAAHELHEASGVNSDPYYFDSGIILYNGQNGTITNNNVSSNNNRGIFLDSSVNNLIANNTALNNNYGIRLDSSNNNTISDNYLTMNDYGVRVEESSDNLVSGNNITANWYSGIRLINSADNTIWRNDITNNSLSVRGHSGIMLSMSSNNVLLENNIKANNWWGINPSDSNNNTITGNDVTDNNVGLSFSNCTDNTIFGNNIAGSIYAGILLEDASNNTFYHNNFANNTNHAIIMLPEPPQPTPNTWDNGFEGNYWSNYTGADANHDGIGDSPHVLDLNNTDNAPLMGPFNSFNTTLKKPVDVISNSTVKDFEYESPGTIHFSVSNTTGNQTHGFCRVMLPHGVLSPPYNVTVNGASPTYVNYTLHDNGTHRWIYFEYEHSTWEVVIIPEFPFFATLPLFVVLTSLAALVYMRARPSDDWRSSRRATTNPRA